MSVYRGDFLGFSLGKIHSSSLNITRVSNNDRYMENITPIFKDQTTDIPGNDGTYYFNTVYNSQSFIIDFAFDDLRDTDIRKLRQVLGFKGIQELVFDETPYKKYMVKCSNPPTLKYIAFDQEGTKIYKGEGTINLVAYYPYALGTEEMVLKSASSLDINNIGDLDTSFKIYFPLTSNSELDFSLSLVQNGTEVGSLELTGLVKEGTDNYICIDMRTNLIEGMDSSFNKTSHLYNRYMTSGDFFKLPTGVSTLTSNKTWNKVCFNNIYY